VVQVGDEQLLLGVAPGRVSTLHVLAKPMHQDGPVPNRTQQVSGAFLDKLNAVLKKGT
jgi:flagellar protein FliO/FliZ